MEPNVDARVLVSFSKVGRMTIALISYKPARLGKALSGQQRVTYSDTSTDGYRNLTIEDSITESERRHRKRSERHHALSGKQNRTGDMPIKN
jgi:hypothetical protein